MANVISLFNAATAVGTSELVSIQGVDSQSTTNRTLVQCTGVGGTGAVTVILEGSLDRIGWVPLVTFGLTQAGNTTSDSSYIESLWYFTRARITAMPSGAAVTVSMYKDGVL